MNCYFYMPVLDLSVLNNWNPLKIFSISLLAGDDDVPFRVKGHGATPLFFLLQLYCDCEATFNSLACICTWSSTRSYQTSVFSNHNLFSKCYNVHVTLKIFLISLLASGDDVPFRVYCVASISWS
ncbi:hypothetical protein M6B38_233425 [Iris pallida]|uniref:Uncharacterized protein n=1 Tax=Iris pallida TaxID=29817 RepID=A0AAX6DQC0_IRIPA|nr:hypothetical protein M6B38_233425 [Iris pallida]